MTKKNKSPIKTELCFFKQVTINPDFKESLEKVESEFREKDYPKLLQAIEVHGYRGASKGKHNGVVPVRPTDTKLLKMFNQCMENGLAEGLPEGRAVKVVAHVDNIRLVGLRYLDEDKTGFNLHIFGARGYDGYNPI